MSSQKNSLPPSPMAMNPLLPILVSLLPACAVATIPFHQSIIATIASLHPNQIRALQTMNIPINTCSNPSLLCDDSFPFRHLISLRLHNCPYYLSLSSTSLQDLSTLTTLELINCPFNPHTNSTPLSIILENLKNLTTLTISYSNLNESLPDKWGNLNLTYIDLSNNQLEGQIPKSMGELGCLETLSLASNSLCGNIPSFFHDMKNLRNLSLENNKLNDDDNTSRVDDSLDWSTGAVRDMAYALSTWILVIVFVMLVANCSP